MTPDENVFLGGLGSSMGNDLVRLLIDIILYSVFIAVLTLSTRVLLIRRKASNAPSTRRLLALSACLFLAMTLNLMLRLGMAAVRTYYWTAPSDLSLPERVIAGDRLAVPMSFAQGAARFLMFVLCDIVTIWRAWVIYLDNPIPRFFMLFLLIGNSCFIVGVAIYDVVVGMKMINIEWLRIFAAAISVSAVTNLTATTLIAIKAWAVRKSFDEAFAKRRARPIEKILIVLIETGAVFCFLQIANVIVDFYRLTPDAPQSVTTLRSIFDGGVGSLAAIYPLLVILLVRLNGSIVETVVVPGSESTSSERAQSICFARAEHSWDSRGSTLSEMIYATNPNVATIKDSSLPEPNSPKRLAGAEKPFLPTGDDAV
ncbi:hypothetical protein DL96DRAFT_1572925 [Flagelloscypha sp. PMI_526]|nr:hypothetical protein DL96DRAFT_1572925 [Flagelloscypha sp. PMI_526]